MSLPTLFATLCLQGPVHTNSHLYQTVIACTLFTLPAIRLGSITSQKLHNSPFSFRRVQLQYNTRTVHVSGCVNISALGGPHAILTLKFTPELTCEVVQKLGNAGGGGSPFGTVDRLWFVWPRNTISVSGRIKRFSLRPYGLHRGQTPIQYASGFFLRI
jgi:hypothetical protein